VNTSAELVGLVPPGSVTLTSTGPAASSGVRAVILVPALLTVKVVASLLPNATTDAPCRSVPLIDTVVPPADGPDVL